MNNVVLLGRLTKDPELRYVGKSQTPMVKFTLAVERKYKNKYGVRDTDFIKIEAWEKNAEFCSKYFNKGKLIGIEGALRVDKYETENGEIKIETTVRATEFNFINIGANSNKASQDNPQYYDATALFEEHRVDVELAEEDLPF
ncbi:MAG: single-stranded DNA-binding protein [Romboutsia sp.]